MAGIGVAVVGAGFMGGVHTEALRRAGCDVRGVLGISDAETTKFASTMGVPDSAGVPVDVAKNTLQVPFNDVTALEETISSHKEDIACVIMEPVMGNMGPILPMDGYLKAVRNVTKENDVLLIFDEVITGFRINMFGAQGYYGVEPDMTTLGKIAGGGLPIGIFGGRKDIMDNVAPQGGVYSAGTYNGHPLSLAAGLAAIDTIDRERVHRKVNEMGASLWQSLTDMLRQKKLNYTVSGIASMFQVFFGPQPENYTDALKCDKALYLKFWRSMLESGVFLPPSQFETCFLSNAHDRRDIDITLQAFSKAFEATR
jgi:glutamate-1-semialdehyde 2,1-aminomutase